MPKIYCYCPWVCPFEHFQLCFSKSLILERHHERTPWSYFLLVRTSPRVSLGQGTTLRHQHLNEAVVFRFLSKANLNPPLYSGSHLCSPHGCHSCNYPHSLLQCPFFFRWITLKACKHALVSSDSDKNQIKNTSLIPHHSLATAPFSPSYTQQNLTKLSLFPLKPIQLSCHLTMVKAFKSFSVTESKSLFFLHPTQPLNSIWPHYRLPPSWNSVFSSLIS